MNDLCIGNELLFDCEILVDPGDNKNTNSMSQFDVCVYKDISYLTSDWPITLQECKLGIVEPIEFKEDKFDCDFGGKLKVFVSNVGRSLARNKVVDLGKEPPGDHIDNLYHICEKGLKGVKEFHEKDFYCEKFLIDYFDNNDCFCFDPGDVFNVFLSVFRFLTHGKGA